MNKRKILVVEDNADIRQVLKIRLKIAGFECLDAEDGQEAIRIVKENRPSLIILDLVLPKKDGLQTYKELKASEATKDIPVIIYTAQSPDVLANKGIEALEIVDFVLKPLNSNTLMLLIEEALK